MSQIGDPLRRLQVAGPPSEPPDPPNPLTKEEATALFDRLFEAGMKGALQYLGGDEFGVEVSIEALESPDHLRLLAAQVEKYDAELRGRLGYIEVRRK